jgi:hypothetical protein
VQRESKDRTGQPAAMRITITVEHVDGEVKDAMASLA